MGEEVPVWSDSEIDSLSRELTAEIEAHRVTRERAEKAEARVKELEACAEEAEARLNSLIKVMEQWTKP